MKLMNYKDEFDEWVLMWIIEWGSWCYTFQIMY